MPRGGGARSSKLTRGRGGKLASKRSKTQDPACSQAMSDWKTGGMTSQIAAVLGRCRSKARMLKEGRLERAAGNEAKAQAREARADRGLTLKERTERAKQLVAERRGKQEASQPTPRQRAQSSGAGKPSLREQAEAFRASKGTQVDRIRGIAAKARERHARYRQQGDDLTMRSVAMNRNPQTNQQVAEAQGLMRQAEKVGQSRRRLETRVRQLGEAYKKASSNPPAPTPPPAVTKPVTQAKPVATKPKAPAMTSNDAVARLRAIQERASTMEPKAIEAEVQSLGKGLKVKDLDAVQEQFLGAKAYRGKKNILAGLSKKIDNVRASRDRAREILSYR